MRMPPLKIAFWAIFWRIFLVTFAIQQFTAFNKSRHLLRMASPGQKFEAFLDFTPYALVLGLLLAALVAVGLDLAVRFLLRPIAGYWYHPFRAEISGTPLVFHTVAGERALAACPARRRHRHGWSAGTLVLTDRHINFYPRDWNAEPWRMPRGALRSLYVEPSRATLGSLLEGVPGRLLIRADDPAEETAFALVDPSEVSAWFGGTNPTGFRAGHA